MSSELSYNRGSIDYPQLDTCPDEYKKFLTRILAMQAYSERSGACEMGKQLHLAPDSTTRKVFARIVYDEAKHASMLYKILEEMGISERDALQIVESKNSSGKKTQSLDGIQEVGSQANQWIDIVLNNMFLDRAGSFMVGNFSQSSFKPWAKACEVIYEDEQFHKAFGLKQLKMHLVENKLTTSLVSRIRHWYIHGLNFFGPPNVKSQSILEQYGLKRTSNEELRQQYINEVRQVLDELELGVVLDIELSDVYPFEIRHAA